MKTASQIVIVWCICAGTLLTVAGPAPAHEQRVTGPFKAVVGWTDEPTYVGFPNSVLFTLSDAAGGPITDLGANDLKVEVSFGDQKTAPLPLEPAFRVGAFGTTGDYKADLIPTRGGEYTFRFFGTIRGEAYDQSFTSGEGTFAAPRNPTDISFPAKDPTAGELAASIERLSNENQAGDSSDPLGMIGVGLGILALIVALAAFFRNRDAAPVRTSA